MIPVIYIGNMELSTYWLMMALGFLAMIWLMLHRREKFGLNAGQAILFTALLMFSGLIGCKLLYILENLDEVIDHGISSVGGLSFFGAVFLIPPMMVAFGLCFRLRPKQSLDACAPCVALMVGVIRVGCFLNGCCGGWTAHLAGHTFRWPTQAMESIGDFVILAWLLSLEERNVARGGLYPRFLFAYGFLRLFVEFLRDTPKDWLFLSHGQWFALAAIVIALACLYRKKNDIKG